MQAVILAAGEGSRMKPLTIGLSASMIPIANQPILQWLIDTLSFIVNDIIIVINRNQKDIESYFSRNPHCRFVYQKNGTKGTANALLAARDLIKDRFMLIYGNEIIDREDLKNLSRLEGNHIACINKYPPNQSHFLEIKQKKIVNVKTAEKLKNGQAIIGLFLLDKKILKFLKVTKDTAIEYDFMSTLGVAIESMDFSPFYVKRRVKLLYPWNILDANQMVLDQTGSFIGKEVEIRPGTYIEHPVAIGDQSILGPNCYIRRYSVIGKACHVGNAVEIKNSIIMDHTWVAHLSYVGDSMIGRNCNIAAGTIFGNWRLDAKKIKMKFNGVPISSGRDKLGGIVGDNVKFGINCVIMPGKRIWPNIMIPPCRIIDQDLTEQPDLKNWNPYRQ